MYEFTLGDIFWLNVEYEDIPNESKIRPAIIIDVRDNEVLLLVATTSVPLNNPPKYYD